MSDIKSIEILQQYTRENFCLTIMQYNILLTIYAWFQNIYKTHLQMTLIENCRIMQKKMILKFLFFND